jgi:cbb3-type cytochrome oxidase subunit 3
MTQLSILQPFFALFTFFFIILIFAIIMIIFYSLRLKRQRINHRNRIMLLNILISDRVDNNGLI